MSRLVIGTDWEMIKGNKLSQILVFVSPDISPFSVCKTCSNVEFNVTKSTDESAKVSTA